MMKNTTAKKCSNRGVSLFAKGEYEKGISDLPQALESDPNHTLGYTTRGAAYIKTK
jgi:Tfp pilus assembly protein PilF